MARGRPRKAAGEAPAPRHGNGGPLGFEAKLWAAADALRNNMDAAQYKHVVLGMIFLKYISDAFEAKHAELAGHVAEFRFTSAKGKRREQFYVPARMVRVLVERLAPYKGRVYDRCCGSGGMFVQSEALIDAHAGKLGDISMCRQDSNHTTWRLAKMNLAIRGQMLVFVEWLAGKGERAVAVAIDG